MSQVSEKVFVQLNGFVRPWNEPDKGRVTNVQSVNRAGRVTINGIVDGDERGWWELDPALAEKLEAAVAAAEESSGLKFKAVCTPPLQGTDIVGFHLNGGVAISHL